MKINHIRDITADMLVGDCAFADGYVLTQSGIVIDLFNPVPDLINIEDIAHGLANTPRWGGHTRLPYSVAQHSIMVSQRAPTGHELKYLMHDCEEAYWGDVRKPLKNMLKKLCPEIPDKMRELRFLIYDKFNIPYPDEVVKKADQEETRSEFESIILRKGSALIHMSNDNIKHEFLKRFYQNYH